MKNLLKIVTSGIKSSVKIIRGSWNPHKKEWIKLLSAQVWNTHSFYYYYFFKVSHDSRDPEFPHSDSCENNNGVFIFIIKATVSF